MKRLLQLPVTVIRIVRQRGIRYLFYLVAGYAYPAICYEIYQRVSPARLSRILWILGVLLSAFLLAEGLIGRSIGLSALGFLLLPAALVGPFLLKKSKEYRQLNLARQKQGTKPGSGSTLWADWGVDLTIRASVEAEMRSGLDEPFLLGEVDRDGRLYSRFGAFPGWVPAAEADFAARKRFPLRLVLLDGCVLLEKNFKHDRAAFLREWHNLAILGGSAPVPSVYRTIEDRNTLYKHLVPGRTIRDLLVASGARILLSQTDDDPELAALVATERIAAVLQRGTRMLPELVQPEFLEKLEAGLDAIHRAGIAGASLTFGNIVVDDNGEPWFIDLESAEAFKSIRSPIFLWARDQDRQKFNRIYGRALMTEESARAALRKREKSMGGWYAPIDFGGGLAVGGFWSNDSGTGRWEYFNEKILSPLLPGKRVLDLGSNNGLLPLLMLRTGAREVVGLELSDEFVETSRLVRKVFEWRDIRPHSFCVQHSNMLSILDEHPGKFDLVTAFCTLYYLEPEEMAAVVRRAAEIAPVLVLQANDQTRAAAERNKAEKSSSPFLKSLLQANGFPQVSVEARPGFARSLLIGRRWEESI